MSKPQRRNSSNKLNIVRVVVASHLRQPFDYLLPENLTVPGASLLFGMRVLVPFGTREVMGFVLDTATATTVADDKLKSISKILDPEPLWSQAILELIKWVSSYYHYPLGEVLYQVLPPLLREDLCEKKLVKNQRAVKKGTAAEAIDATAAKDCDCELVLNAQQQQAVDAVSASQGFQTFLLDGVTGSGKTEVYLQIIAKILQQGKQALVLVPEINLTPQTISRFQQRFAVPTAVIHSKLNTKDRFHSWLAAKEGTAPIVIGTRSAIFTPLAHPGVIIIDEEHDLSFKQQSNLRYSARDLAIMRAKLENIPIMLGSATPALETLVNAQRHRYVHLRLSARAGKASYPQFHVVDMRNQKIKEGLAEGLLQAMERHLDQHGQILLFLNNRGYAPILLCNSCGWNADCKNCDAHMTLHRREQKLHCHHCGAVQNIPQQCGKCGKTSLFAVGLGTEKIEAVLPKLFPGVTSVRVDRDTTSRKGAIDEMLASIHSGESQILVGTQMLAKGHHFPNVTLAAILNVDNGLFSSDFRASEHLAQLIVQVAGRAGRAERPGEVYMQTHNPNHPLLQRLIQQGYHGYAQAALLEREHASLPPFSFLALFRAEARKAERALEFLENVKSTGQALMQRQQGAAGSILNMFGPTTAPMERKAGFHRYQLLLQSSDRVALQQLLRELVADIDGLKISSTIKWSLDVDPIELG